VRIRAATIEAAILQDREEASARPKHKPTTCHACGREYTYRKPVGDDNGRFCSVNCREVYDAGAPAFDPDYANKSNPRWYSLSIGPQGFWINCAGCRRRFDSKGLRCCSDVCERKVCNHEDDEVAKTRGCSFCGRRIPKARGNRAKYCEDACGEANRRFSRFMSPHSPNPADGAIEPSFIE
jgi:hypothetical protein